jgi:hypothetical protein
VHVSLFAHSVPRRRRRRRGCIIVITPTHERMRICYVREFFLRSFDTTRRQKKTAAETATIKQSIKQQQKKNVHRFFLKCVAPR